MELLIYIVIFFFISVWRFWLYQQPSAYEKAQAIYVKSSVHPPFSKVSIKIYAQQIKLCSEFYKAIGAVIISENDREINLKIGRTRIDLIESIEKQTKDFELTLVVEDAEAWYEHLKNVLSTGSFDNARVKAPVQKPRKITTQAWDPLGNTLFFVEVSKYVHYQRHKLL